MVKACIIAILICLSTSIFASDNSTTTHNIEELELKDRIDLLNELAGDKVPINFSSRRRGGVFNFRNESFKVGKGVVIQRIDGNKLILDPTAGGQFTRSNSSKTKSWMVSIKQLNHLESYSRQTNDDYESCNKSAESDCERSQVCVQDDEHDSEPEDPELPSAETSEEEEDFNDDIKDSDDWINVASMKGLERDGLFEQLFKDRQAFEVQVSNDNNNYINLNGLYFISELGPMPSQVKNEETHPLDLNENGEYDMVILQTYFNYEENAHVPGDIPIELNFEQIIKLRKAMIYLEDFEDQDKEEPKNCFKLFWW